MSELDLLASSTALLLAASRTDTAGMSALLLDRSERDLIAMLAYCARFSALMAEKLTDAGGVDVVALLKQVALAVAGEQATLRDGPS